MGPTARNPTRLADAVRAILANGQRLLDVALHAVENFHPTGRVRSMMLCSSPGYSSMPGGVAGACSQVRDSFGRPQRHVRQVVAPEEVNRLRWSPNNGNLGAVGCCEHPI